MSGQYLNIVSFTIPFPANYGGVIDVYYKLLALKNHGIKVILHCYQYDREPAPQLEPLCEKVYYYARNTGFTAQLSFKPYIVKSRQSSELLRNLLSNSYPILFEGLHSCYFLDHPALKNHLKIYRESNIEHQYYLNLAKSERKLSHRIFFLIESLKLKFFQQVLANADLMLVVSEQDTKYLQKKFPGKKIIYLPSFHGNTEVKSLSGIGKYVLYHGNLSVAENERVAEFLIREVFEGQDIPLIIAGLNPSLQLKNLASAKGIKLTENPSDQEMSKLIQDAQINLLVTFQATGLKLKLLNTLFNGRFCLVNRQMLSGTGLEDLCVIAESATEIRNKVEQLFISEFEAQLLEKRRSILQERYSDEVNVSKMLELIQNTQPT
ncbi:MAG: glycosyltransferase family 1 protein [Bacteroidetes bacterium]|nr:glycosyltransferase family 1 protein [Bacteroidota bacterium]